MQCPSGLEVRSDPPSCRRIGYDAGCSSVIYQTNGISYSQIYGKIHARYSGSPDGFQYHGGHRNNPTLEDNYVDGVSLTYGTNNRTHIWTFAASINLHAGGCAVCNRERPGYIGMHYSCELDEQCYQSLACNLNQLWDGGQCVGGATFYRQLSQSTTDDIEMRVCRGQDQNDEDILITFVEIFVQ